jgi:hypothetical protein
MRTPYQRPKRLNDGHSLANSWGEVGEHMRTKRDAVSEVRPVKALIATQERTQRLKRLRSLPGWPEESCSSQARRQPNSD